MKLFIIARTNPYFENSASANRLRSLIDGLRDLGMIIHLYITRGYKDQEEYKSMGRRSRNNGIEVNYLNRLFNNTIWLRRINNYLLLPLAKSFFNRKILAIVANNSDAIIWTDSDYNSFRLALKIKKQFPRQRLFLELSEYLDIYRFNKGRIVHKLEGKKRQLLFDVKALYAYDGLALMTKQLMKHYKAFSSNGPMLLHLPMTVDLERFMIVNKLANGFNKPYIAFVGVMNNAKEGVNILIKAFSIISKEFPTYRLYLIGSWHYDTDGHINLISNLNLEGKVFWMGEYNRDEIPHILKNADLLVLPRPDSRQAQGGFPTKLGEYLASGNPVCATKVGEIPDYLTDGESVYFAEPGSVESFANAMRRALSNPEEASRVGANGRKVAETHFNKDIQAKILFDFIRQNLQPNS